MNFGAYMQRTYWIVNFFPLYAIHNHIQLTRGRPTIVGMGGMSCLHNTTQNCE